MTTNAWPKEIVPLDGEVVRWHRKASRAQTLRRVVGGTLFLTSCRLLFRSHIVDRALNRLIWATALDDIAAVGVSTRATGRATE